MSETPRTMAGKINALQPGQIFAEPYISPIRKKAIQVAASRIRAKDNRLFTVKEDDNQVKVWRLS